jgi:TonB family protein
MMHPENALLAAGFLQRRCYENVEFMCPMCGGFLPGVLPADLANGYNCPTCGPLNDQPLAKCGRCKEGVGSPEGERECLSVQAYRKGVEPPAFAPAEPIWAFKRREGDEVKVAAQSELQRRFSSGELDAEVMVCGPNDSSFAKAGVNAIFRGVARAPVPVAPVPAPVVGGGRPAAPAARPPALPVAPPPLSPSVAPPLPVPGSTPLPRPRFRKSTALTIGAALLAWGCLLIVVYWVFGSTHHSGKAIGGAAIPFLLGFSVLGFLGLRGIWRRSSFPMTVTAGVLAALVLGLLGLEVATEKAKAFLYSKMIGRIQDGIQQGEAGRGARTDLGDTRPRPETIRVGTDEAERLAVAKAETERVAAAAAAAAAEAEAEAARFAAARAEAERIAVAKAEAERLASARAEAERIAVAKAETERFAAVKARVAARRLADEAGRGNPDAAKAPLRPTEETEAQQREDPPGKPLSEQAQRFAEAAQQMIDETGPAYMLDNLDAPPNRSRSAQGARYPREMRRQGIEATVSLAVWIDRNGSVRNWKILSPGRAEFEEAAIEAVRGWKYSPGRKGGQAVAAIIEETIPFTRN